jgi:hypothetical protein
MKRKTMFAKAGKRATAKSMPARGGARPGRRKRPQAIEPRQVTTPEGSTTLTVRVPKRPPYSITLGPDFKKTAAYWEYVLRNRIRWLRDGQVPGAVIAGSVKVLAEMGLNASRLSEIAKAGAVEIEIPYTAENEGWEFRIFPWEFMLDCATSEERRGAPLIVIRHIRCPGTSAAISRVPKKFMVVESAPGPLGAMFEFSSEKRLVQANLGLTKTHCAANPTVEELAQNIAKQRPDVIHLAGVDSHQGMQLLSQSSNEWDGYMMAKSDGTPEVVIGERLAGALRGGRDYRAQLVSCNFYNSAARVAAMIAAVAAYAAIGFQDEVDDRAAEEFFANFYFSWRTLGWDLLEAFRVAVSESRLEGAVVVLWSTRSLLARIGERPLQVVKTQILEERKKPSRVDLTKLDPQEVLDIVIKLKGTLNYSLLQNDADLFDEFSIRKLRDGTIRGIGVEVTLFVGRESSLYTTSFDAEESMVNLAGRIRFTLTSALLRSIRESVNTVISIKVTWNSKICYLDTKPLKLLAIDEWVDTPELDAYLPSFVFPRDRAVAKIIDSAQRYLMALKDDSGAGFDGYQGVDLSAKDPTATVDLQALAIWSALSYDLPVSYINPPPTFTESSQRLRTPSDVIEGRRGTCIDLALLLAACLEYIGIYPVIFLLTGHAFPGYWRSEEARQSFIDMTHVPDQTGGEVRRLDSRDTLMPSKSWCFNNYSEVVELARRGSVVPIESVWLTQHEGFWEAVDEGMNDLRSKREFALMIDVQGARSYQPPVTPLPILRAES